jgi:hypothetical protein
MGTGVNNLQRETDYTTANGFNVRNAWIFTSTPHTLLWTVTLAKAEMYLKAKAVPLHAMEALRWRRVRL